VIVLNPRLYLGIIKNSVLRYIQIDLKYKFQLFSDVIWLVLDIVAFTFLGGMVDSAVEPNEYYNNFETTFNDEFIMVEVYDSFANEYYGEKDFESYIRETGTLKEWEEWSVADNKNSDNMPSGPLWIDDVNIRELVNGTADPYRDGIFYIPRTRLSDGTHFMEIRFEDVDRTGRPTDESVSKAFSSSFFVGEGFWSGSTTIYVNVVNFTDEGEVKLQITDGRFGFNASRGILRFSLDGEMDTILNLTTRHDNVRLLEDNIIQIKDLEKPDGSVDKGEHTITIKFIGEDGNTTYIGKHSFLVGTKEWQNNDLGIDYSLKKFFLIGVLFWAFFAKSYEDTVNTIPDEATRGTIGFLITNHVNLSTLLISRYISASLKTFVMAMIFVFPVIAFQDVHNALWGALGKGTPHSDTVFSGFTAADFPIIILILLLMWLFMLVFSLLISSLNIVFKRILPFAMMMVTGLKVLTGYYFPLEALETQLEVLGGAADMIKEIPLVNGVYLIREIIVGKDVEVVARMNKMLRGTIYLAIITLIVYKYLEKKSRKWGTLEFY